MQSDPFFESNYKRLGFFEISPDSIATVNQDKYKPFIKVLYLPAGYTLLVDFKKYTTTESSLFFINSNQILQIQRGGDKLGYLIYYNRDFYCVQIHDAEVACDGLLFNNVLSMPMTTLEGADQAFAEGVFTQIRQELNVVQSGQEEMIRTYLKQLIIRATRIWKKQQLGIQELPQVSEIEFFRDFSRLVEIHFREKHTVADYADLMGIAPKTLTHRLKRMNHSQPNEFIKDRIMLEAKRLLSFTPLSAKEIAFQLGYEDPAYFNRLFAIKTGGTTSDFRKKYNEGKMYN